MVKIDAFWSAFQNSVDELNKNRNPDLFLIIVFLVIYKIEHTSHPHPSVPPLIMVPAVSPNDGCLNHNNFRIFGGAIKYLTSFYFNWKLQQQSTRWPMHNAQK